MTRSYPTVGDLEYLLNRAARKLRYPSQRTQRYVTKLLDVLDRLNHFPPTILSRIPAHQFYTVLRDLLRDLFIEWHSSQRLSREDIYLLKAITLFFHHCLDATNDVLQLRPWLIERSFIQAFVKCLGNLDQLLVKEKAKRIFKQVMHLFDILSIFYQRLPKKTTEEDDLDSLFEGTMDCLMSFNYDRIFRQFPVDAPSMTSKERFFLLKCPSLIHSYRGKTSSCFVYKCTHYSLGAQSPKIIQQILETMIPRYALLLDQHIEFIKRWKSPLIEAVHHLLLTVIYARDSYSSYANGEPFRWLIDHLIRMISEWSLIKYINEQFLTPQTRLINVAVRTLTTFIHEPDLLVYVKNLKVTSIFRSLISLPNESIVLHAYVMLTYILEEDEIKASKKDVGRLLSKMFDSLRKKLRLLSNTTANSSNNEHLERDISLLIEALHGQ